MVFTINQSVNLTVIIYLKVSNQTKQSADCTTGLRDGASHVDCDWNLSGSVLPAFNVVLQRCIRLRWIIWL